MEQVDATIIPIIAQLGCKLPGNVQSISDFGSEHIYLASAAMLKSINPNLELAPALPKASASRYRECTKVTEAILELGYTGELGYQAFLYPNAKDMRKLLMWLGDKLPKVDDGKQADEVVGGAPSVGSAIKFALAQWTSQMWSPQYENKPPVHTVSTVPLSLPGTKNDEKEASPELTRYWTKFLPLVTQQPAQPHMFPPSLFEFNAREIIFAQEKEKDWDAGAKGKEKKNQSVTVLIGEAFRANARTQGQVSSGKSAAEMASQFLSAYGSVEGGDAKTSSAFSRRMDFAHEGPAKPVTVHLPTETAPEMSAEAKEEAERKEREEKMEALRQQYQKLRDQRVRMEAKAEEAQAMARTMEGNLGEEDQKTAELEKAFKIKKRTIDLLPNAGENVKKLQEIADVAAERLVDLAQQWEDHRGPLLAKYRKQKQGLADKKLEVGTKVAQIKRIRQEGKEKAQQLKEKEVIYQQAAEELSKMPKGINRQVYVRRIMEIVKNLEKQKLDIAKVLQDVHQVQKDINSLSQKAKRSFDYVDEIVFQAAKDKKDPTATATYKNVVGMRDAFVDLVKGVEEVGKIKNEMRDITSSVEALESRNMNQNLEKVQKDLKQVQEDNMKLANQIKKLREGQGAKR